MQPSRVTVAEPGVQDLAGLICVAALALAAAHRDRSSRAAASAAGQGVVEAAGATRHRKGKCGARW